MDPILDSRLSAIEEKLEKNQHVLLRIRRAQKNAQLFKIFYWVLILMLAFGSFYYIQPYLSQLLETYTGIQTSQEQLQNSIPNLKNVNSLIEQFKAGQQ